MNKLLESIHQILCQNPWETSFDDVVHRFLGR